MRKILFLLVLSLLTGLFASLANAATFKLTDGTSITGELLESGANDATALINAGGEYKRIAWGQFSQEDLKSFLTKYAGNKKIVEAVEPFIEIDPEERSAKTEVAIKPAAPIVQAMQQGRAEPKSSLIPSLFKSGLGVFLVLFIYGANIYAGFEIGIFRARPTALVAGLAAIPVVGLISNIIFLSMPTRVETKSEEELAYEAAQAANPNPPTIAIPGQEEAQAQAAQAAHAAAAAGPQAEVYSRGKTTFNKRFIETKLHGFFGMTRRDEDKPKVLIFKTTKGEFVAQRITRATPAEIYIQADRGGATLEISFAFPDIVEITIKPHA